MPFKLLQLAEDNGIAIEYADFFYANIEAAYIAQFECHPVICLSTTLNDNRYHLRSVLAHELGHHFATGKSTLKSHMYYSDKIESSREEKRAWRWAVEYLIPTENFKKVYNKESCEVWQLAEYFEVDEELIRMKMELLEEDIKKMRDVNGLYISQQENLVLNFNTLLL